MGDSIPPEVSNIDFELDEVDLEMLVAGPADDQYNDILDREVLQHLGLFGTPADHAPGAEGAQPGGGALLSLMSLGPGEKAASQVASLLQGTHPSLRGANLAEWLGGGGPVVSLSDGLTSVPEEDAVPAGAAAPQAAAPPPPPPTLLPAAAFGSMQQLSSPPVAAHAPAPVPVIPAALPLQQQIQMQQQAAAAAAAAAAVQQQQQQQVQQQAQPPQAQPMLVQLPGGGFAAVCSPGAMLPGTVLPMWQHPVALMPQLQMAQARQALAEQAQQAQQAQQQAQQQQAAPSPMGAEAALPMSSPQSSISLTGSASPSAAVSGGGELPLPVLGPGVTLPPLVAMPPEAPTTSGGTVGTAPASFGVEEDDEMFGSDGGRGGGAKPSNKKFSNRQQTRITAIEAELQKLQRDMQQMKLENMRLKEKNLEVELQLRVQEQVQQLAAAAAAAVQQQQMLAGPAAAPAGGLHAPPLGLATSASPPNSQRKLLMHLTVSARPADAEMLKVSALTWPKLQDWYRQQYARLREVVSGSPQLGCAEAEQAAKEALRSGRYWDLLVLICRPDLSVRMLNEDYSAPPAASPPAPGTPAPPGAAAWPAAALAALELGEQQRGALAAAWRQHCEAAAQRAQRRQELLAAIRSGFLQPLQRASPSELELGKPLARQGLEAMEALRLVVRQDHVASVQVVAGLRKLVSPLQHARLAVAAWPFYPDPSKWAPLLLAEQPQQ